MLEEQSIGSALEESEEEDTKVVHTQEISVLDKISLATMAEGQQKDPILSLVYKYVAVGIQSKPPTITQITLKQKVSFDI